MRGLIAVLGLMLGTCLASASNSEKTNLGAGGNELAALRFAEYQARGFVCAPPRENSVRVLLSGFGPFNGGTENASGEILKAFGNFARPTGDLDAYGSTLELEIEGVAYQICFVVTSVKWDIAAAILISEMERFAPSFLLMTGLGSFRLLFETGNSNRARFAGGYDFDGNPAPDNTPAENYVLPPSDPNVEFISRLSWDAEAARLAVNADVEAIGFATFTPPPGYEANNYLCNNVAYAVSHAARGHSTELAGGRITLRPTLESAPKIGFMHYPAVVTTDPVSLANWEEILKKIIVSQVK